MAELRWNCRDEQFLFYYCKYCVDEKNLLYIVHNRFLNTLNGIFKKSFNSLSKFWCYGIFGKTVLSNFKAAGT